MNDVSLTRTRLESPLFMVGTMRSGTTLLADLLGNFPGIVYCPFELKHIWSSIGGVPMASPKTHDAICQELSKEDVQEGQAERLSAAFLEEMAKNMDGKNPDAIFLNKNPHLCNKLPFVLELFPDARFMWTHRALHRVVGSMKRLFTRLLRERSTWHYWPPPQEGVRCRCWSAFYQESVPATQDRGRIFPGGDVSYLAEYWLESNMAVRKFLSDFDTTRWIELAEEDIISDPSGEIRRCLLFLNQSQELPAHLLDGVLRERDFEWSSLLTTDEIERLDAFADLHKTEISRLHVKDVRKESGRLSSPVL